MSGFFPKKLAPYLPHSLAEKEAAQGRIARIRTVSEFLGDLIDAVKDTDLPGAIAGLSPWAEAVGSAAAEAVPAVKFVVKLFENLGRIDDAPTLGYLACCLAYQRALERALKQDPELRMVGKIKVRKDLHLKENAEAYDFTSFSLDRALQHSFVQDADQSLRQVLVEGLGLEKDLTGRLVVEVRTHFVSELLTILSDRGTSERFEPFFRFLHLRPTSLDAYADLRCHAEYQRRLFEEQPVLGVEPFALQHVYIDLDCGHLAWGQIDRTQFDPFQEENGGRHRLLDTVLRYLSDAELEEALIIQGPAGAGKSTFTLRLCCALAERGLRPIRVELKNLATRETKDPWEALPEAVELDEKRRGSADLFLRNRIFEERLPFRFGQQEAKICPYVLILDGWDEISSSASQGYQQELDRLLRAVRDELFRRTDGKVRVILAGRPTGIVGQSALVNARTRVLTLRDMKPKQLEELIERFRDATARRPLTGIESQPWNLEHAGDTLKSIQKRYSQENSRLEVLGLPLLAYLTLRLVAESPEAAQKVTGDTTSLYRSLVDLVVQKAGKPDYARTREKNEPVITGHGLRRLLQDTAAAMTALDVRNISRDELKIRLGKSFEQLDREVRALGEEQVLGRLLISFFFKGGHPELGCEFSHKSFREYLFAEKIVERLKAYGRQARPNLPLRAREGQPYWQDFSPDISGDGRYEFSRDLLEHLGPQWLQPEELAHIRSLLAWEIGRVTDSTPGPPLGQPTTPLERAGWYVVRDGLADLWDWWGEGIHLLPLPQVHRRGSGVEYQKPLVVEYTEDAIWRSRHDSIQTPVRITTFDGHLGDGLFSLCAIVHAELIDKSDSVTLHRRNGRSIHPNQIQRNGDQSIRFAPAGVSRHQFLTYIARINACGFRSNGYFPLNTSSPSVDFSNSHLSGANFSGANLYEACFHRADLADANFRGTNLCRANLGGADLRDANLSEANLRGANIFRALLLGAKLLAADLREANFSAADLREAPLYLAGIFGSILKRADLSGSNLSRADLRRADLSGANLSEVRFYGANLSEVNLSGANLSGVRGLDVQMLQKTVGIPSRLPDGTAPSSDKEYRAWLERQIAAEASEDPLTPPTRPE